MHLNYLNSKQVHLNEKSTIDGLIQTLCSRENEIGKKYLHHLFISQRSQPKRRRARAHTSDKKIMIQELKNVFEVFSKYNAPTKVSPSDAAT